MPVNRLEFVLFLRRRNSQAAPDYVSRTGAAAVLRSGTGVALWLIDGRGLLIPKFPLQIEEQQCRLPVLPRQAGVQHGQPLPARVRWTLAREAPSRTSSRIALQYMGYWASSSPMRSPAAGVTVD